MWHKALIINVLKAKASNDIDKNNIVHNLQTFKMIIHKFWESREAWKMVVTFM